MTTAHPLDDAPLSRFHKKLALYASGGPFLDGYVLSIIGVALVQISPAFNMSSAQEGLVGASALVGIFLGAFLGGWLTDKFGRQVLFTIDLAAIIVCSIAQFWVGDVFWLIVLRLMIGMAVGADYPIATSLLAEFSPRKWRGPLLGAFVAMWFVGAAAAYLVGEILLHFDDGWRWMLASAAVPAILIVLARLGTPESPRWLLKKGRVDEANEVLRKVSGQESRSTICPKRSRRTCASAHWSRPGTASGWRSSPSSGPARSCRCSPSTPSVRRSWEHSD